MSDTPSLSSELKARLMRNPRMDIILERLGDSHDFWEIMAGYVALVCTDSETEFPGEMSLSAIEFCAALNGEIQHAEQCILDQESNREHA